MDGEVVRQLQVDSIDLVGGDRQVELLPGLNVVLGPIATGKSTFVKLLRALFTSIPDDLAPEVTANVTALRAACTISSHRWTTSPRFSAQILPSLRSSARMRRSSLQHGSQHPAIRRRTRTGSCRLSICP